MILYRVGFSYHFSLVINHKCLMPKYETLKEQFEEEVKQDMLTKGFSRYQVDASQEISEYVERISELSGSQVGISYIFAAVIHAPEGDEVDYLVKAGKGDFRRMGSVIASIMREELNLNL